MKKILKQVKQFISQHLKLTIFLTVCCLIAIVGGAFFLFKLRPSNCGDLSNFKDKKLPTISKKELTEHDGVKKATIYLGYNCLVYDVSKAKDSYYGVGHRYHYLVGRDSTEDLDIFGGKIIKSKYPVVGIVGN